MHARHFYLDRRADPAVLVRRIGAVDEVFRGGEWLPTAEIRQWDGNLDALEPVSESDARSMFPAAFDAWV